MSVPTLRPLVHDKGREAVDSIRGYFYQVLRSIQVWMDLGEEEALFLEGAENLDRAGLGSAVVEQVKNTAGSGEITLRTPAVMDAIGHACHDLRRVNRDGASSPFRTERYTPSRGAGSR